MEPLPDKAALLTRHDFFRDLPATTIRRLSAHARVISFAAGARIFCKGDDGNGLMAVFSGHVRISVASEKDAELMLNLVGPGEVFGEISLLDGLPRTADATAMSRCRLLHLERRDFLAALLDEPSAALILLKVVSGRLRKTSQQLEQSSFGLMSSQLAQTLVSLAARTRAENASAATIRMSQKAIGNMIGLSRETTNRYLRAWHNAGVIALERGGLTILDSEALARLSAP